MKRITILILALAGAMLLGGSAVFAAGQIARSSAIREKDARSFTYVDAGILPEEAEEVSSRFGFEKGRFVYEIEFTARGLRYKYVLDSGSGAVLEKEMETIITDVTGEVTGQSAAKMIGVEKAKKIALKDAGFSADAVVFTKARQEKEGGREIYDIEFYVPEDTEYEYEIDVYSGQILEKDAESIRPVPTEPEPTEPVPTEPAHTEPVPTEPVSTEPVPTEPVPTEPVSTEPVPTQPVAPEKIGVEKAKKIALKDAGFSADAVVFTKARQEKEGGREIYDI
ncbi:MAG: PepSY domain-containing protein, partial [Lachnospiraceae bacterium]|nr:PepSY domain-containing protein [Lachnospiraceae bacterium]